MRRLLAATFVLLFIVTGCSAQQGPAELKNKLTEQDVRNAVTDLVNGINSGNVEVVKKYVGTAGPVAERLIEKLKNNIKLYNVRDISIRGTTATATVTLEVVPLKVQKDMTLNFNVTDVLLLNNPLGLLTILL